MNHPKRSSGVPFCLSACWLLLAWAAPAQHGPGQNLALSVPVQTNNCTVTYPDGVMVIEATGENPYVVFAPGNVPAPVLLELRMNSAGQGLFEVYWRSAETPKWSEAQSARFDIAHDGEWHDYTLPLLATGTLLQLRIDPGAGPGKSAFEYLGLREAAKDQPPEVTALPEKLTIGDEALGCEFDPRRIAFTIEDRRTGRTWRSAPADTWLMVTRAIKENPGTLALTLMNTGNGALYPCRIAVSAPAVLTFELEAADPQTAMHGVDTWPPRIETDFEKGMLVFCDRSCGVYTEQTDATYGGKSLLVYGNTQSLDMPWIGLADEAKGDGVMVLLETPADAMIDLAPDAEKRHWPQVRWMPSMGVFGYPRRVSYRFLPEGGYVALAKHYREYVRAQGRLRTLAEKAAAKPRVAWLRGAPSIWGDENHLAFIREARTLGMNHGLLSNCRDPGVISYLTEHGYLIGEYDSYTDILEGDPDFQRDHIEDAAYRAQPGAGPLEGWRTADGVQYYIRSSALALNAAQAYVPQRLADWKHTSRFIDVSAAINLFEDHHPNHTFDRRRDLEYRRGIFEYMNGLGLVVGTEYGNDWAAGLVDYFEGAMSGPFWWSSWPAAYLMQPTREQLSPEYLKYGMGYERRIPLWELVYHDCAVSTWYWGDNAGFLYQAAPELSDRKDLFNLLYGTVPLFWIDGRGYGWPNNRDRFYKTYHETCKFHEIVGFDELVSHEFLSEDRALQRTRFSSGAAAVVNFADEARPYQDGDREVMIAPRGYCVHGPDFEQTRLIENGEAVTIIKKPGYLTVDTASRRQIGPVELEGRMTAFQLEPGCWHLILAPGRECTIDLAALTGWPREAAFRLRAMDFSGEFLSEMSGVIANGILHLGADETAGLLALIRQ